MELGWVSHSRPLLAIQNVSSVDRRCLSVPCTIINVLGTSAMTNATQSRHWISFSIEKLRRFFFVCNITGPNNIRCGNPGDRIRSAHFRVYLTYPQTKSKPRVVKTFTLCNVRNCRKRSLGRLHNEYYRSRRALEKCILQIDKDYTYQYSTEDSAGQNTW